MENLNNTKRKFGLEANKVNENSSNCLGIADYINNNEFL